MHTAVPILDDNVVDAANHIPRAPWYYLYPERYSLVAKEAVKLRLHPERILGWLSFNLQFFLAHSHELLEVHEESN